MQREFMESPLLGRDAALMFLFAHSIGTAVEITIMIRNGLVRPCMGWVRKLYETYVDARFIELDLTGFVASRWLHWAVAARGELLPNDEGAQREYQQSKRLFADEKEYPKHGAWAKVPGGKVYKILSSRARYVDKSNDEQFGYGDRSSVVDNLRNELLAKTNAQAHPTLAGDEAPFTPRFIIFLTVYFAFYTLLAYKNGIDDHRDYSLVGTRGERLFVYPPHNDHLSDLAHQMHERFLQIFQLLMGDDP